MPTQAYRFDLGFGVETGYTDNVDLTENGQSDIPVEVFTNFRYSDRSPRMEGLVEGRVGYREYLKDNASDEFRPRVRGNLLWHLDPDRWEWYFDGVLRQVRSEQLGPDSPSNRETQGVLSTGPNFRLPLSAATSFQGEGRAGYVYNGDSDDDNYRIGGALRVQTKRGRTASISANLEGRVVRYTENTNSESDLVQDEDLSDFEIVDAFFGYSRQDASLTSNLEIGGSFAHVEGADRRVTFRLRAELSEQLTQVSKGGMRVSFGYEDEGNEALDGQSTSDTSDGSDGGRRTDRAGNAFNEKRAELYYELSGKRNTFGATTYTRDRDFIDNQRDETNYGLDLQLSRRLTRRTTGRLYGNYEYSDFEKVNIDYKDYEVGMELRRRISRKISASAQIQHQRRSSNDSPAEYDETAVFLSIAYVLPLR